MKGATLSSVPGRGQDLAQLKERVAEVAATGRGGITFVAGDDGSGRTALLRALVTEVERARPRLSAVAGAFGPAGYVAWDAGSRAAATGPAIEHALALGDAAATLTGDAADLASVQLPIAHLLAQVFALSAAAFILGNSALKRDTPPDLSELMPSVLRAMCSEGPVVCIIDDAHLAPEGWWADLLVLIARRVARDEPLLMVLAVDGPEDLGEHEDGEPNLLYTARSLTPEGLASWHSLSRITRADLEAWTGPAEAEILDEMIQRTGGRAAWLGELWRSWIDRSVIHRPSPEALWRFCTSTPVSEMDALLTRVARTLGGAGLPAVEHAREILCCAALEGQRFTGDAVALALRANRDTVIDTLDADLAVDQHPDGFVIEEDLLSVRDERGVRHLWLYSFRSRLDWLTLRHHGLTTRERRDISLRLADALRSVYGGEVHLVAPTLARLYEAGEQHDDAARFRSMANVGGRRGAIVWRARMTLRVARAETLAERRRGCEILLAAAFALLKTGPTQDGLEFAEGALRLATTRRHEAEALYLSSGFALELTDTARSERDAAHALAIVQQEDNRALESYIRSGIAKGLLLSGHPLRARSEYLAVLEARAHLKDVRGQGSVHLELGRIERDYLRDYKRAQNHFYAAVRLAHAAGDLITEAEARGQLATTKLIHGYVEEARRDYGSAIALHREAQNPAGVAAIRHLLGHLELAKGDPAAARAEYREALDMQRRLGQIRHMATTHLDLGRAEDRLGDSDNARREYQVALTLFQRLGNRKEEAVALRELAKLDASEGSEPT